MAEEHDHEQEQEQEQEQEMISHFSHEHPLTPIPESGMREMKGWCRGCYRYFLPGEAAYGCSNRCGYEDCLHKECLEMPREIRHPLHPSHPLKQLDSRFEEVGENWICAVCKDSRYRMSCYVCIEGCELFIHLPCAVVGVGNLDAGGEEVMMQHLSHPVHKLKYMRRPCSFMCDACGTTDKGSSYSCSMNCQYWIHESCANLPPTASYPRRHHHPLSLAFCLPFEYIRYEYTCDVCKGVLRFKHWVYHCQLCRYVAHLKCVTNTSLPTINNEDEVDGSKDIVKFPINEVDEELIKPFVAREIGERGFGIHHEDSKIINGIYQFHNHPHPLKLIMSSPASSSSPHYNEEDDDDDDDDDEDNYSGTLQLSCDGCTMPIHEHKQRSSPNYYLSCGECKYFLHLVCFYLPLELPCLPVHSVLDHKLTLRSSDKLTNWTWCNICRRKTNGLYYGCNECSFEVDIICASLPDTIKHAAHPQRHHYLKLGKGNRVSSICAGCYDYKYGEVVSYRCDSCRFEVCWDCVLLPATNRHRSEKHLLPLTYDANLNHPSEFYCGHCERRMNPKSWMYHCRDCDQSFHPHCFPATSGKYRNVNFGSEEYKITPCHPQHPLKFRLISKKKYCDRCLEEAYDGLGFQCASCNFVMCFFCGYQNLQIMKAIDY